MIKERRGHGAVTPLHSPLATNSLPNISSFDKWWKIVLVLKIIDILF